MEKGEFSRSTVGASRGRAPVEAHQSGHRVQLKSELKSLSYRDGAEALSPQSASAVQRAEEAPPEDKNVKELKEKVAALVASKFEGDYMRAFQHYAGEGGMVSRTELSTMLKDAGIGNALTRGYWVDGVMEKVDADKDQQISQSEFLNVLQ